MTRYAALTAQGARVEVEVEAGDPAAGMQLAAGLCGAGDWPVTLYATDHAGALVAPVWGGKRGLAGAYPEGETPEDAARLFGPGGEPS
jgi:hypothetical protein